jgi:hypothetical protein
MLGAVEWMSERDTVDLPTTLTRCGHEPIVYSNRGADFRGVED